MSGYSNRAILGTFGAIQIAAHDRTLLIDITGRNYTTADSLQVDRAHVRLPVSDAIRLHAMLTEAIAVAEEADARQSGLWSETTISDIAARVAQ